MTKWSGAVVAALVLVAGAARAANAVSETERGFVLVNMTHQEIDHVTVTTTDGKEQHFNDIPANQRLQLRMSAGQCVSAVHVRLHDGRQLLAQALYDCRLPLLTVTAHRITVGTEAR